MRALTVCILSAILGACFGARILSICPMPSRSHGILLERLLRELGNRGHEITYITGSDKPSKAIPNMTVIEIPGLREHIMSAMKLGGDNDDKPKTLMALRKMNPWIMLLFRHKMGPPLVEYILDNAEVQKLMASDKQFDLIFGEIMMDDALLAGFSYKYNAPIIAFAPFMPNLYANYLVGNPAPASYIPETFLAYSSKMSFCERFQNFVFATLTELSHYAQHLPVHDETMRKYFGTRAPYIGDIMTNTSLVLVNTHHSLGFPRPNLPNVIEIAGVHINGPKELREDLKSYMNNAKNDVILFSLGSNINSSDVPPEIISGILKGLGRLREDVIWKYETTLENVPKNVKLMKWLPQSDILAHPNLRLFITHGGMLSTTEALARGVPVVGIPLMGDQYLNMKITEGAGWGLTLNLDDITEDTLFHTVREVIDNPKYKETVLAKSAVFNDEPMPPLERSVWWIEYVLRHRGAYHLRSAAQDLALYELYNLDVIAVILIGLVVSLKLIVCGVKTLKGKICGCSKKCKKVDEAKKDN